MHTLPTCPRACLPVAQSVYEHELVALFSQACDNAEVLECKIILDK